MAQPKPGRYRDRDPATGTKMMDGITAIVSERTGGVSYQARWSWVDQGKQRRFGSQIFKELAAAEEFLLETLLAVRRGIYQPASTITVDEYVVPWMERKLKRGDWRSSTYYRITKVWERIFSPVMGNVPLADLGRYHCQEVIRIMEETCAPSTVRVRMETLTTVLNEAEADGLIARNPMTRIDLPKGRKTDKAIWSLDQARTFLDATSEDPDHVVWWFLLMTGCRIGEAIALRWSDVDLDGGRAMLRSTRRVDTHGHEIVGPGTKSDDRTSSVPLIPELVTALKELRTARRQGAVVPLDDFVFLNERTKKRFTDQALRVHFDKAITAVNKKLPDDAKLPRITPHGVRHTTGTLLASLEVPGPLIQKILRHASIQTTANTYLHPDGETLAAQVAKLGAAMNTTTSPVVEGENTGSV